MANYSFSEVASMHYVSRIILSRLFTTKFVSVTFYWDRGRTTRADFLFFIFFDRRKKCCSPTGLLWRRLFLTVQTVQRLCQNVQNACRMCSMRADYAVYASGFFYFFRQEGWTNFGHDSFFSDSSQKAWSARR